MKLNPSHSVSVCMLVNGTGNVLNHQFTLCAIGQANDSLAQAIADVYRGRAPLGDGLASKVTAAGVIFVDPKMVTLISVDVVDLEKLTDVKAFGIYQEQIVTIDKAKRLAAGLPNIMMPGRA